MDLQRFAIKLFAVEGGERALPTELIPVFHRWIQTHAVDGMLIDVADYSHVAEGPGILLIAHEANYALDETGGRRGLLYARKQPMEGTLAERMAKATDVALRACRELESAPELRGRLRFRDDEIQIIANDRLAAPNDDETWKAFEPELRKLLETLQPGVAYDLEREADPRERFAVTVKLKNGSLIGP